MSTSTAEGFMHEVGFYASDAEFADLVIPFAREGGRTGEPVIFAYDKYKTSLLQQWLPDSSAITYITDSRPYATPAKALGGWRKRVQAHIAAGAARVRIAGNVPHPGYGIPYTGWDRYEAAIDRALGDLPVWAPCLYDSRIAPADVLERATSLHQSVRERDGTRRHNADYREPTRLTDFLAAAPDPLAQTAPTLDLSDPAPATLRTAIRRLAAGRLRADRTDVLLLAASEAVANAIIHGTPPVSARAWVTADRMIIQIHDTGAGPTDPLTGLFDSGERSAESGRGLWIAHQLDLDVAMIVTDDGFTVRLRVDLD
ncbi:MAG TPA: anti-sigma factor RsbA family regulatory protein [Jatrophihabitans sp.]|jgi:anti-sigma regulatory factor (Ser/Thr protein kinase)